MKLSDTESADVKGLLRDANSIKGEQTVEGAAQKFTEMLYKQFQESLVLVRLFATIPAGRLPRSNRTFVNALAASAGVSEQVTDNTMVLSLLGTSGELPEWNDRRRSKGHVGIPLASVKFVDSIPMISRLLNEIGMDLEWIDDWDTKIVSKGFLSQSTGMFYVEEAATAEDQHERKIIVAQDFVARHGIKTVFGFGSGFQGNPTLVALIVFTRETLPRATVRALITIMEGFKRAGISLVLQEKFFA